jgi:CheY-like chemotaxis protein
MSKATIMVIEDDAEQLDILTTVLTSAGYLVTSGIDVTAVYAIEKHPPALLRIDNWLSGGKTGHDVCYQLKQNPATASIPVILISATVNLANTAQRCQATSYIIKPFDIDDLLSQVGKHLR